MKASAYYRSSDSKEVNVFSEEWIAETYGILIERVKRLNADFLEDVLPSFSIISHEEYLKKIKK